MKDDGIFMGKLVVFVWDGLYVNKIILNEF